MNIDLHDCKARAELEGCMHLLVVNLVVLLFLFHEGCRGGHQEKRIACTISYFAHIFKN